VVVYLGVNQYIQNTFGKNSQSITPQFQLTPLFWALLTILIEILIISIIYRFYQLYQFKKVGINEIDKMNGEQFEEKLCVLFNQLGYSVDHYSKDHRGNEYGVDLIIQKDGIKTAVQAKRYGWKQHVDNTAVEKLVAGKTLTNCNQSLVVTNSAYTQNARYVADKLNVELWDRKELVRQLLKAQNN